MAIAWGAALAHGHQWPMRVTLYAKNDHVVLKTPRARVSFPAGIKFSKTGQAETCPVILAFALFLWGQKVRSSWLYPTLPPPVRAGSSDPPVRAAPGPAA
jgi:hypothetical protein